MTHSSHPGPDPQGSRATTPPTTQPAAPAAPAAAGTRRRDLLRDAAGLALGAAAWLAADKPVQAALPTLMRGFNLANWFEYERNQGLTADELAGLAAMGLDHVRLPFDPLACGWNPAEPDVLPFLPDLAQAVQAINNAGLTVLLDMHLQPEHKLILESEPAYEPILAGLWGRLAQAAAVLPQEALVYELLNEPQYYGDNASRWPAFQRQLLAAVRAHDTTHAVLLCGAQGSGPDSLESLPVEADVLAGYSFHFYDPFLFTHQAAPWIGDEYTAAGQLANVPYPATSEAGASITFLSDTDNARQAAAQYISESWDAAAVRSLVDRAASWARASGVALRCTEFGVIRQNVSPEDRYRWLRDVRQALEANGIGWTVWDYTHLFGLTVQSGLPGFEGQRTVDPLARTALGLAQA